MFPGVEGFVGNIINCTIMSENILPNIRTYSCILKFLTSLQGVQNIEYLLNVN